MAVSRATSTIKWRASPGRFNTGSHVLACAPKIAEAHEI
jgi:hypothetical protein